MPYSHFYTERIPGPELRVHPVADKITAPLFSVTGCMVAVLYWVEFAWWARWFSYFVALPFLVQFADEAVERWRVLAGKPGVDW